MDARSIGDAVLVGHSMGGLIAVATCLKHPERVSRLILVDPGGYGSPRFLPFRMMRLPIVGELLMSLNYRFVVEQSLKGVFYDSSLITPDVVDSYYNVYRTENARKTPLIVIRNLTKEPPLSAAVLTHVRCPVLVIWGANDEVIPPSNAYYFEQDLSDVKLMMVPEAGHLPHVEKADKVNQAMIEFISAGP
jgi:pimeloyl-ACP methyl ester carboxylesterase